MKRRIVIFSTAYLPLIGGSELAIKEIADRLPDFDFTIITARLKKSLPKEEKSGNTTIYRLGFGNIFDKFLLPILGFFKALKLAQSALCLHAYQASYGAGAGYLAKLLLPKIPTILTLQEGKELDKQNFLIQFFRKLIIKKADQATVISNYLKEYILNLRRDLKIEVIPNGVDIDNFNREFSYGDLANLEQELGIQPDDKVIISVSRLVRKNGLDLLIRALALLNSNGKYKLILAGEGLLKKDLEILVSELGLENKVIFNGEVNHQDLPRYLKIADVFVRPSRSEGLGIAFLEAMAAKVPVVATRVGGIPDLLEDRKTGLFCSLDPQDIAFKIRIFTENDNLMREVADGAFKMVREKYDWDIVASKFNKLYKSLM